MWPMGADDPKATAQFKKYRHMLATLLATFLDRLEPVIDHHVHSFGYRDARSSFLVPRSSFLVQMIAQNRYGCGAGRPAA